MFPQAVHVVIVANFQYIIVGIVHRYQSGRAMHAENICKYILIGDWRCGGSLVAHQTSGAEVLDSNPTSPTTILMR